MKIDDGLHSLYLHVLCDNGKIKSLRGTKTGTVIVWFVGTNTSGFVVLRPQENKNENR
jgi:hypothetical protein